MYTTLTINPLELLLDETNPRFLTRKGEKKDQESIINYLVKFEEIKELAIQINSYGGLIPGERILAIKEGSKYVVLEGNRRTTAMKLLLNPNLYSSLQSEKKFKNFPVLNDQCKKNISRIQIDVVQNRENANFSLIRRHINGIKKWSPLSKMYFYQNLIEQGKNINQLVEMSLEKKGDITRLLKGYSVLRLILDNYHTYFPNSNYINENGETFLETELIAQRLLTFYAKKLGVDFDKSNFQLLQLPNQLLKDKFTEILVNIAYLVWELEAINTRNLNTNKQITSYFTVKQLGNTEQNKLVNLVEEYINVLENTPIEESSTTENSHLHQENHPTDYYNPSNQNQTNSDSQTYEDRSNFDDQSYDGRSSFDDQTNDGHSSFNNQTNGDYTNSDNHSTEDNNGKGRPRKQPEEFDFLLKAYPFKNKYTKNKRINQILVEIKNISFKDNSISSMFLIRTLLETYVNDYIDYFASLDRSEQFKLKNISSDRSKRKKTLRELIFQDIYLHLKDVVGGYPETYELIQATFTDNNNTSTMQIIHFYVHSAATFPDSREILDAWKKISQIITTLDILLSEHSGQK